jgi:hypothetical protein
VKLADEALQAELADVIAEIYEEDEDGNNGPETAAEIILLLREKGIAI